jgi:hypothetical protein
MAEYGHLFTPPHHLGHGNPLLAQKKNTGIFAGANALMQIR